MLIKEEPRSARDKFSLFWFYHRFERIIMLILTALIAIIVVAAL